MTTYPSWEEWVDGWDVVDGRLVFEHEPVEGLPPHLLEPDPHFQGDYVPMGPWNCRDTRPRNWLLRFLFENGWEAVVYPDWGVALNPATIHGFNRRLLDGRWPKGNDEWDDPRLVWQDYEMEELGGSYPHPDDPDHLIECIAAIAALPSDR